MNVIICCLIPYAVDVSGGVETDGSKDFEKMRAFIAAVKGSRENE